MDECWCLLVRKTSRYRSGFASFFGCRKEKLKPIIDVLDAESLFNSTTWDWLAWSANYYRAALGDVLFQALPVKLRNGESAVKMTAPFGVLRTLENKR